MPSSAKKKGASKRRKKEPVLDPDLALLTRFPSGEPVFPKEGDYPAATDVILFMPAIEQDLPGQVILQLRTIVAGFTAQLLDVLMGPLGPLYLVLHDDAKLPRLASFLEKELSVPGSDCRLQASRMSFKDLLSDLKAFSPAADTLSSDDDFQMPSSSDSEPEPAPVQRKPAATVAKREVPLPKNLLQALRAPADSLPPIPVVPAAAFATSPETMDVEKPEPDNAQPEPEPSQPAAGVTPPFTAGETAPPTDSPTSALSSQRAPASRHPRRKLRYRTVDFRTLVVEVPEQPPVVTVLIRPLSQGDSLRKVHPKALITDLSKHGDYTGLRDIRLGGMAVDFPKETDAAALLALTTLAGIPVSVELPRNVSSCSAVLSGVNPLVTEEEVRLDLTTSPPSIVTAVKRLAKPGQESWSVKVTFEGTSLPDRGFLYGRSRRLLPYKEKPLCCSRCSRFGHSAKVCRSGRRCGICSLDHEDTACPNVAKPLCPNCGGAHDARNAACPARQFHDKVCAVKAASKVPHRVARTAVNKAAKSFAEAVKASQPKKTAASAGPNFLPNVAHPRPPTATATPDSIHAFAAIFKGLIAIMTAAIATGDLAGALKKMTGLFAEQVPGADPGLFAV